MLFDENTPYDFKITCPLFADDLQLYPKLIDFTTLSKSMSKLSSLA